MASNYLYDPYVIKQTAPVHTLTVNHGFGRSVNTKVILNNGEVIYPKVFEVDSNNVLIRFYEKGVLSPIGAFSVVVN